MDAIENRRILQLAALAVLCLAIAGPGRASTVPGSAGGEAACAARASSPTPQPECLSVQIGLAASPNPTPSGGTVSFSWSVSPATDCWDNLGNGAWGNYSFARSVTDPFTWVVSCTGSGVESATLDIAVEGPPPPDPPPPPPGDHNPKGWLDGVDANGVVAGWACDPDSYGAALEVRLYLDGAPGTGSFLGNPTASIAREAAVGDACGGNRNHGFAFTLPGSAQDGQTHSLYAYAVNVGAGNNVQLSGSPASFQLGSEPPPPGDGDDDGVPDAQDNCPDDANQNQLDSDGDGSGDECDIDMPLEVGDFEAWEESEYSAPAGAGRSTATAEPDAYIRCKTQLFAQRWKQAHVWDALRYEGMFRVCYRPNNGIVSISDVHGDMAWTAFYLTWQGNDPGYPYAVKYAKHVDIYYRGSASFCIIPKYGCGPTKHPWVTITFYDDNTMEKARGVL